MKALLFTIGIILFNYEAFAGSCRIEERYAKEGYRYFRIFNAIGNRVTECTLYNECTELIKTHWQCQKDSSIPFKECRSNIADSNSALYQLSIYKKDNGSYTAYLTGPGFNQHYTNLQNENEGITNCNDFTFVSSRYGYGLVSIVENGRQSSMKMNCGNGNNQLSIRSY